MPGINTPEGPRTVVYAQQLLLNTYFFFVSGGGGVGGCKWTVKEGHRSQMFVINTKGRSMHGQFLNTYFLFVSGWGGVVGKLEGDG